MEGLMIDQGEKKVACDASRFLNSLLQLAACV